VQGVEQLGRAVADDVLHQHDDAAGAGAACSATT
jgi:hypothetical protein